MLILNNITKKYKDKTALDGVSLELDYKMSRPNVQKILYKNVQLVRLL